MIDIHNHVIFDFDDGPKSIEESIAMLRIAMEQGITDVFATSHINELVTPEQETSYFKRFAALEEELETMELYMNIENMRFSNQINYKAIINPNIETSMIKVPSLILQPFLENALWHGLSTKEGDKSIVLEVEKTASDFVTIKITDNGVGRAASRKIESNKSLNRKSVGIALTMERLANFSKNFSTSYRLNIIDLKDDQGNAMGTQVIIDIPVEQLRLKTA